MGKLDVFTVRDLRTRTGEVIRDAERGRMSLMTKHGRPSILAVPFDERLLEFGVDRALAISLFEQELVTLSLAARIARVSVEEFMEILGQAGVAAATYSSEELDEDMEIEL